MFCGNWRGWRGNYSKKKNTMQTTVKRELRLKQSEKNMQNKVKERSDAKIVLSILFCFPFNCPEGVLMQTKPVRDLWVLSKSCQTNSWSSSLFSQPSPTPTLQGWNFLLMAQCKRPLSHGKLTLKMSTRDIRRRKLQNRNACHDGAFWLNLGSLHCWHTFLFTHARETDYY